MGDRFNMSGDFRGATVNIKSTLTNVQQSVGELQAGNEADRAELQLLISQLSDALQQVPEERQQEAVAVAQTAESLVDQVKSEQPNKTMLRITGQGLKQAASNLAEVMPAVVGIAAQIVLAIGRLTGTGG